MTPATQAVRIQNGATPRDTLAFNISANLICICYLGGLPKLLLPDLSLLAQFVSQNPEIVRQHATSQIGVQDYRIALGG